MRRLAMIGVAILGLGVPVLMAYFLRRQEHAEREVIGVPSDPVASSVDAAPGPAVPGAAMGGAGVVGGASQSGPPDVREPHPTGLFAAVGRFAYRFRRVLPLIGLALVIGLNVWSANAKGQLIQGGWVIPGSEEQRAADLMADRFGQDATTMLVVYEDPDGDAASPAFQAKVEQSLSVVADDEAVDRIVTYADQPVPDLLSND